MKEEVVLDNNDTMRVRKCWWMSHCQHEVEILGLQLLRCWTVEVPETEVRIGKGRKCPICEGKSGSYVCDGFPTFQGAVVFAEADKEQGLT